MVDESKIIGDVKINGEWYGIFYYPEGETVFSATRIQRLSAVYDTNSIDAGGDLISWKELSWTETLPADTKIFFYVKTASSRTGLDSVDWQGPFRNGSGEDISSYSGRYMQIRVILIVEEVGIDETAVSPKVSDMQATAYIEGDEERFFSKTYELGFKPQHMLLSYNSTSSDDTLLQFAVTGKESVSTSDYQFITPNTIVELDQISDTSTSLKVLIRGLGSEEVPFEVDEFAVLFSGQGQYKLNNE